MNYPMIRFVLGWVFRFQSLFLLIPALTALIYQESTGWIFLATAAGCFLLGMLLAWKKPRNTTLYSKEGHVIVAMSWILMSFSGAIPLYLTGDIPSVMNAIFESVSGFTTTGASILGDVEILSKSALLWRSFSHWIGGMGVLVFIMAFLPLSGAGNMNLMRAESPGPMVEKLVPRVRNTAVLLYGMYLGLTVIEFLLLLIAGMPLFDAVNTAFSTAGTGGFGILNDSINSYTPAIQLVVAAFMLLFGVNFNLYFLLLYRRWKDALHCSEVWVYLGVIVISTITIAFNISSLYEHSSDAVRDSFFTVSAFITSTGFGTADPNTWPEFSRTILMLLMTMGACAGSTGGGIKVARIMIVIKTVCKEIHLQVHPRQMKTLHMDGHIIPHENIRQLNVYLVAYVIIFALSLLFLSFEGHDFMTNFSSVLTALNNIGPIFSADGSPITFEFFSVPSKCVLIFDMIAGRLELFPMILLFSPITWKK